MDPVCHRYGSHLHRLIEHTGRAMIRRVHSVCLLFIYGNTSNGEEPEMERVVNLLVLNAEQQEAFTRLLTGHQQIFAPDGYLPVSGEPLPLEFYRQATIILGNPPVDSIADCHHLKLLHTRSAGVDRYLVPGVLPPGTMLAGCSGAWGPAVAEHVFALLLSLMKQLPAYYDQQKQCVWHKLGKAKTLIGARVLCIGTGDLGSSFARLCRACGAHTIGIRRNSAKPADGISEMHSLTELDEQLSLADVVCLMLPHSQETDRIINLHRLCLMKPGAILLNGGRGSAVDCDALARVMEAGHLYGAGLDVTFPEPLPPDHPLWMLERVLITPHACGGYLDDTLERIASIVLENLQNFLTGEPLKNRFQ